jgi:hypothetical protein
MMKSSSNSPADLFDHYPLYWQMTQCERIALSSLVHRSKASVAIEVGTYKGGSLQVIAPKVDKVYSLDIDPQVQQSLRPIFSNVEFLVGNSAEILPNLVNAINQRREDLGFVLIDGDHTAEGVKRDINSVLQIKPLRSIFILMHDSFNPDCRQGILQANWQQCPWVHSVELDFVPGVFHAVAHDQASARSMWGGLAVALLLPEKRAVDLQINQCQKELFEIVFASSCHAPWRLSKKIAWRLKRVGDYARKLLK